MAVKRGSTGLQGRVVAITGAGHGIGAQTAKLLAAAGAAVALGDSDEPAAQKTAVECGPTASAHRLDISRAEQFDDFLDAAEAAHGPIDVVINNAGIMPINRFADEPTATSRRIMEVNTLGTIFGTRAALQRMLARQHGHIINVASSAGKIATPGLATYSGSKYAIIGFTEALRLELRGTPIDLTLVMPGVTATRLSAGMSNPRLFPPISPQRVAEAIHAVVVRPRFEVYVPAALSTTVRLSALLPRPVMDRFIRLVGADRAALDAVHEQRRAQYEADIARDATNGTP